MQALLTVDARDATYAALMAVRRGDRADDTLARMLASCRHGVGSMPRRLGLDELEFHRMMQHHFPGARADHWFSSERTDQQHRLDEMDDLRTLLMQHRSDTSRTTLWMTEIVTTGCLAADHLWQDLGLWKRKDLTILMRMNFKSLAERNNRDMKWKKFLYKQLCETEGIYTCRAPSCEVCADYSECFGSEE